MFDILKTIGEVLIALFIIRYLIQRYNTLGRIREPVRRALADISTYRPSGKRPCITCTSLPSSSASGKATPSPRQAWPICPGKAPVSRPWPRPIPS